MKRPKVQDEGRTWIVAIHASRLSREKHEIPWRARESARFV
jgi:hypothetical protein